MVVLTRWPTKRQAAPVDGDVIGTPEAGRILGLSNRGVLHHIKRGRLDVERRADGVYLLRREQVEALASEGWTGRWRQRPSRQDGPPPFRGRGMKVTAVVAALGFENRSSVYSVHHRLRFEKWRGSLYYDPASVRAYRRGQFIEGLGPTLMSTPEIADVFGMQMMGVRMLIYRKHLPAIKLGQHWYAVRADVERLHREGWRCRRWSKVLSPYEERFRKCERDAESMRRYRAAKKQGRAA